MRVKTQGKMNNQQRIQDEENRQETENKVGQMEMEEKRQEMREDGYRKRYKELKPTYKG